MKFAELATMVCRLLKATALLSSVLTSAFVIPDAEALPAVQRSDPESPFLSYGNYVVYPNSSSVFAKH